jgi:hypothetical protein
MTLIEIRQTTFCAVRSGIITLRNLQETLKTTENPMGFIVPSVHLF